MNTNYIEQEEKFKENYPTIYEDINLKLAGLSIGVDNCIKDGDNKSKNMLEFEFDKLEKELNFLLIGLYGI